nr:hypothetical protein RAR13_11775 [Aminobacter aminovorans]
MTAYSKAAKRAQKRGRPILPAELSTREPNGRPSRRKARASELEQQIKHVAVSRRIRQFGLVDNKVETAEKQAEDPRHGYLLGRMFMDGTINAGQHEAGMKYAEDMARYFGLTGVAFPSARAQDLFAVRSTGGEDSQSKADAARTARDKMVKLRSVLLGTGDIDTGRRIDHTVRMVCVEDIDHLRTLNAPMKAWLVRGLNALAKFYEVR